jgi:hypothetical protein
LYRGSNSVAGAQLISATFIFCHCRFFENHSSLHFQSRITTDSLKINSLKTQSIKEQKEARKRYPLFQTQQENFTMRIPCLAPLSLLVVFATTDAFLLPRTISYLLTSPPMLSVGYYSPAAAAAAKQDGNVEEMKKDIEQMRQEAMRRLDALNEKMHQVEEYNKNKHQQEAVAATTATAVAATTVHEDETKDFAAQTLLIESLSSLEKEDLESLKRDLEHVKTPIHIDPSVTSSLSSSSSSNVQTQPKNKKSSPMTRAAHHLDLLDYTRWRVMFNIGREAGTWMPKTWGVSGERLLMNLEIEFQSQPLFDRDEFLNDNHSHAGSIGGASSSKVLHVVNNELTMSPTMQEGSKRVRVRDGGWRVAPGEGPIGSDVLRFYFQVEEEVHHTGSDVYCPKGRIYCTCGYFDMQGRSGAESTKESLQKEINALIAQYEKLAEENEADGSLVSWEKVQRGKKMMDLRMKASKLNIKMNEARVKEPEKHLLRLSRDLTVGLTREGGVCCKVQKGLAIEYRILGKFEVGAMDNREHSDYRDLLP